jgi:hypothetical protein
VNAVRKAIESEVAATVKTARDTTLDAAVLNGNEAIKINISTRYWLLILIFLTLCNKDMKSENMVSGFIGEQ